ncbi:extracellular GDSL-like lipase/acylhydrolase [Acaromyces ingoldii]|uniref:Extracellular GDSL-like lipase/acylhydrolase n=1 Tax=Acaromyces ingoldii TaxID=215250 RepID=A0A316YEY1_9BASI|nr:extracellular GDSL-like lipase/acylhydrolase [Acaromyces ingoldii]PWN87977.1 extracellular GDSL-like lipase/acylhydrolase [Acaromyces ingoldii]
MPQLTEPANLPPAPYNNSDVKFLNATLRQTFKVSRGARRVRMRFTNVFGGSNLDITSAWLARPLNGSVGTSSIVARSQHQLTFSNLTSFSVPNGALVVSDPVHMDVANNENLTVSMYLGGGQAGADITSHPGSRTTTYIAAGDQTRSSNVTDAVTTEHWYFIDALEVEQQQGRAIVIVGDSLTDGRASTENGNDRWPDQFYARFPHDTAVTYLNQAAGGNRVLADGLGPNALGRIDRDVLAQTGAHWVILFEGVNDIGTADATPAAQDAVVKQLLAAYDQIITRVHAQGKTIYGATITPFGLNTYGSALREASRQTVNDWIRSSQHFDAVLDFDAVVRDPANHSVIASKYDSGDGLHMNPAGYGALAASIPLSLFE